MTNRLPAFAMSVACFAAALCAQPPASAPAALAVAGDVATPLQLTPDDLAKMPRTSVTVDDTDGAKVTYEGVALSVVLQKAGGPSGKDLRGKALAGYVVAKAHDGYEVVLGMGETDAGITGNTILVADKRDGKPLFQYQGPFRLVIPGDKAGARQVRMLERLEVVKLVK